MTPSRFIKGADRRPVQHSPVTEDRFEMEEPISRMFETAVIDPFVRLWLIKRILE